MLRADGTHKRARSDGNGVTGTGVHGTNSGASRMPQYVTRPPVAPVTVSRVKATGSLPLADRRRRAMYGY
jgi:hypothetical protein